MSEAPAKLRTTALTGLHEELGAKLVDFAGWSMPVWYEGATDEHHAVRQSAGLFDLGHMGELMVTGSGAGAALDHALLLNASAMPVGRARYTMITTDDGGIIDDLIVYRLDPERWMVVANASNAATVSAELRTRNVGFDATLNDDTDSWALIAIQGPQAADILQNLVDVDLTTIRYYRVDEAILLDQRALIARTGYTGEDGFELFVPGAMAVELWQSLAAAGGDRVRPCGLASRDTLRLEAGMPLYGNELTLDTTPYDVGSGRLVKADGPAHVGSEALRAASTAPHQYLVGLNVDGRRPARTGYDVAVDGASIGTVTSGTLSPTLERPIAMARVTKELAAGDRVTVDVRGKPVDATVTDLPFYTRP